MVQTISNPKNQSAHIKVEPGQTVAFDFDISTAGFERSGNDLTLNLEDGGQIVLNGFFLADGSGALPALRLADGTEVASKNFLSAIDPELDITPSAEAIASTGLNTYTDSAGELIDGLDASGTLTPFFWGNTGDAAETPPSSGTALLADAPTALTPPTHLDPPTPPAPPVDPVSAYDARAVLYTQDGAADAFNFRLDAGKSLADVDRIESLNGLVDVASLSGPDADGGFYSLNTSAVSGNTNTSGNANIYDYITIHYTDGSQRIVQVILNQDGTYSSAAEDTANPPGGAIAGEWHTQTGNTTSTGSSGRSTSNGNDAGNDEFWLQQVQATGSGQNHINTGGGDDQIQIANGVQASEGGRNSISTDDGNDIIRIGGGVEASELATNYIYGGDGTNAHSGNDTISIGGALKASKLGMNYIYGDDGDDAISINGGMQASAGGNNRINSGIGDDAISVNGMQASESGKNFIYGGDGKDAITISGGLEASKGGINKIYGDSGILDADNDTITISGGLLARGGNSSNEIYGDAGDDAISLDGGLQASQSGTNRVYGGSGDDAISIGGGVQASEKGRNLIYGNSGDDTVTIDGNLQASEFGQNYIYGDAGDDAIRLNGDLQASEGGKNYIYGGDGNDAISIRGGVQASEGGYNRVDGNTGNDDIRIEGGVQASGSGVNNIDSGFEAGDIITIDGNIGARQSGQNYINGRSINSLSIDGEAALSAKGAGYNELTAGDGGIDINIQGWAGNNLAGVEATENGRNQLRSDGQLQVTVAGGLASATAVSAADAGRNELVSSSNIQLSAYSDGEYAVGLQALQEQPDLTAQNYVEARNGRLDITAAGGHAIGISAVNNYSGSTTADPSGNTVYADTVEIKATGELADNQGSAVGMQANNGENWVILGESMSIVAQSGANGQAYGMRAALDGSNFVYAENPSNSITVTITAAKGAFNGLAMYAEDAGHNNILGSAAADSISINGDVQVVNYGQNQIMAGSGDDSINLNGRIGVGALDITAADGYDQLTLHAENIDEFNSRYKEWLEDDNYTWNIASIESVRVAVGGNVNLDNLNWLNSVFANEYDGDSSVDFILDASSNSGAMELMGHFAMGNGDDSFALSGDVRFMGGLNLSGGDGMDTIKLGELNESSLDLDSLANMIDHFEVLDLSGGNSTNLTIDSLLDGLSIDSMLDASSIGDNSSSVSSTDLSNGTVLRVTGDTTANADSVSLGGTWNSSSSGTVEYDGITYNVYTNTDLSSQDQYLLIQTGLI